ncbi:CDGSH iron-sulfur domain-containing protein [Umezawaea sp.]|uniref:CDGSH iron-sulfur domain-containing protein n=1 Tax=Umezawaea sp. TaxID=1955258 RepID=UPI002ED1B10F
MSPDRKAETPAAAEVRTTITSYEDGPLLVRGDFELRTHSGEVINPGRATVALCRCGLSLIKPLCDGTHKSAKFHASGGDRER